MSSASNDTAALGFWTIQRKLLIAVTVSLLVAFPIVIMVGVIFSNSSINEKLEEANLNMTNLIGGQVGGALKFKKLDAIAASYANMVGEDNQAVANVFSYNAAGEVLAEHQSEGFPITTTSDIASLVSEALENDILTVGKIGDLQVVVSPAHFGKKNSVVGAIAIVWSFEAVQADLQAVGIQQSLIALAMLVILVLVLFFLIGRIVAKPINSMTAAMTDLADGNLNAEIPSTENTDEMGAMAHSVLVFKENAIRVEGLRKEREEAEIANQRQAKERMENLAQQFESTVGEIVNNVESSSSQLKNNADVLSSTASDTSQKSSLVDIASKQASQGVETVAAATEELSASIQEISHQVQESSHNISNTVGITERTTNTVEGLSQEATKIGEVVTLIQEIAEQTNLLALNATIEAARAGDAGKGFAVVANEVKSLANQTAKATDDISRQVTSIQGIAKDTVGAIAEISEAVQGINAISSSIASAVEEQTAATGEISRNINETTISIGEVSSNIQNVSDATAKSEASSQDVSTAADNLSNQSNLLSDAVDDFLSDIRSQ